MKVGTSYVVGFALVVFGWLCAGKQARAQVGSGHRPEINYSQVTVLTQKLAPNFYAFTGSAGTDPGHPDAAGGRVGALVGPDGTVLVDASYAPLAGKFEAALESVTSAPVKYLVNTHEHPDHTGGNPYFARLGAVIFAREETRLALEQPEPAAVRAIVGSAASFTDPQRLPVVTYGIGATLKLRMNGEVVDLIPLPPSHTNGDTVVRFEKSDVMMIGDVYRNYGYPFVDTLHGGNFRGVIQALDLVMQLSGPQTKLVPGHGTTITRSDIPPYLNMITSVRGRVQRMVSEGDSLEMVLAAHLTAPYDAGVKGGLDPLPAGLGTSADRFVSALYAEVKSAE
jgi:cyclase